MQHIANQDFAPVIAAALEAPGYAGDGPADEITVGFGHNAVLSVAGKVIEAVKSALSAASSSSADATARAPAAATTPSWQNPFPTTA